MRKRLLGALAIAGATAQLIGCSASPAGPEAAPAFDRGGTQTGITSAQGEGTLPAPTDSIATMEGGTSRGGVFIGPGA
jgi:hypothetical protein